MATAHATQTATWHLDPAHSSVEFSVKHMMMTTVRGRFKQLSATLTADEEHPEGCCVEVTLEVASLDTGVADRDAHSARRTSSTPSAIRRSPSRASASTGSSRRRATASGCSVTSRLAIRRWR
jgi:hypothetical protein